MGLTTEISDTAALSLINTTCKNHVWGNSK